MTPVPPAAPLLVTPEIVFNDLAFYTHQPQRIWDNIPYAQNIVHGSIAWLNFFHHQGMITWKTLNPAHKQVLVKFLKVIHYPTYEQVFSDFNLDIDGPLWHEACLHSTEWKNYFFEGDRQKCLSDGRVNAVKVPIVWLGHSTFYFSVNFSDGKVWRCLVNPHEASEIFFPEQAICSRLLVPLVPKESLSSPSVVLLTDLRPDCCDAKAIHECAPWSEKVYAPRGAQFVTGFPLIYNLTEIDENKTYLFQRNKTQVFLTLLSPSECSEKTLFGHSNSYMISWTLTHDNGQKEEYNILILGRFECCTEKTVLAFAGRVAQRFPSISLCFTPIDWLLSRKGKNRYPSILAASFSVLRPKHIFPIGWGTWPFLKLDSDVKDIWADFIQTMKVHNLIGRVLTDAQGKPLVSYTLKSDPK